ncbi:MAG TPA: hypothetical protein VMW75_25200, partial [Thermoanaerobaculia bacterium]|nr:hypothetical protein [Thermoanaerobaculia bacterium]
FLGPAVAADPQRVETLARVFAAAADAYAATGAAVYLLSAAEALAAAGAGRRGAPGGGKAGGGGDAGGWGDPRSDRPWGLAAAAVLGSLPSPRSLPASGEDEEAEPRAREGAAGGLGRAARLALAEALLTGPTMRLRGISAERILEGLVSRHLSPLAPPAAPAPQRPAPARRQV